MLTIKYKLFAGFNYVPQNEANMINYSLYHNGYHVAACHEENTKSIIDVNGGSSLNMMIKPTIKIPLICYTIIYVISIS